MFSVLHLALFLPLCAPISASAVQSGARASAQDAEALLFEAYFLERERGELERAAELYRRVLADAAVQGDARAFATERLGDLAEDIASADLARLVPPETLVYVELDRPGAQLTQLLEGLGLLTEDGLDLPNAGRLVLRRELVEGLIGIRGAALAITRVDPNGGQPHGVLVVHPGDHDLARSALAGLVPANATRVEPIGGRDAYRVEGGMFAVVTRRLVLVGSTRRELSQALLRLDGELNDGLASNEAMKEALAARAGALLSVTLNGGGVAPMLDMLMAEAGKHDPGARVLRELLDPASLSTAALRLTVDEEGLELAASLELREDHQSLGFHLLRTARLDAAALDAVPVGAAGFVALALNDVGSGSGSAPGRTGVSMLDIGRELFANLDTLTLFALEPAGAPQGMPDVALVLTVDDASRSREVWSTLLGLVSVASGAGATVEGTPFTVAGVEGTTHAMQGGPALHVVAHERHLILSPSLRALGAAIASTSGASIRRDTELAAEVAALPEHAVLAAVLAPARLMRALAPFMPPHERDALAPIAEALAATNTSVVLDHGPARLALRVRVNGLPRIERMLVGYLGGGPSQAPPPPPQPERMVEVAPVTRSASTGE